MAYTNPLIPTVDIQQQEATGNHLITFGTVTGNPPTGTTYTTLFAQQCVLEELDGTAVWQMTGIVANPSWTAMGTGAMGATGFTGYTGPQITGYTGYTGTTGPIGTTGYTGPGNFTGYTGYTGVTGYTGYTGYTGTSGYTGYTGYTGKTGYTGYTGPSVTGPSFGPSAVTSITVVNGVISAIS